MVPAIDYTVTKENEMNRPHQDKTEEQIRRFQRLVEIQIRKAYAQRNTKALENLQAWDLELQNELLCRD